MCPSSWKLYVDDFPFFGSSLACLEPELELFEVWEINVRQIIIIVNSINSQTSNLESNLEKICVVFLVVGCLVFGGCLVVLLVGELHSHHIACSGQFVPWKGCWGELQRELSHRDETSGTSSKLPSTHWQARKVCSLRPFPHLLVRRLHRRNLN